MNGDAQFDLSTLTFNNGEQLEGFYRRILILQQEIILSGETVYIKIIIFHYMKAFSKSDKIKGLVDSNMTYLIKCLEKKSAIYRGITFMESIVI